MTIIDKKRLLFKMDLPTTPDPLTDEMSTQRIKRFRSGKASSSSGVGAGGGSSSNMHASNPGGSEEDNEAERKRLKEMIFLRDLHFGFLPDDCETEFAESFEKIATDATFAAKCFKVIGGKLSLSLSSCHLDILGVC